MTYQTYQQAIATLPKHAKPSSWFGNPGMGGFTEYYRTTDGRRWEVNNGSYADTAPFTWTVRQIN